MYKNHDVNCSPDVSKWLLRVLFRMTWDDTDTTTSFSHEREREREKKLLFLEEDYPVTFSVKKSARLDFTFTFSPPPLLFLVQCTVELRYGEFSGAQLKVYYVGKLLGYLHTTYYLTELNVLFSKLTAVL